MRQPYYNSKHLAYLGTSSKLTDVGRKPLASASEAAKPVTNDRYRLPKLLLCSCQPRVYSEDVSERTSQLTSAKRGCADLLRCCSHPSASSLATALWCKLLYAEPTQLTTPA